MADPEQTDVERGGIHPAAAIAWGGFLLALVLGWWFSPGEATVRAAFDRLGPLSPAAYTAIEFAQVVIAPVPGQPFEIAGGWLLGLTAGMVLGSIGTIAGSIIAFRLARRYGRPLVERRLSPKNRRRVEKHLGRGRRTEWIVFLLMLVPAFPRDPLAYLAGLTGLSTGRFALIATIGRPVGLAPAVALGSDGVRAGVELQLVLAVAAGGVWLVHAAVQRVRGASAGRSGSGGRAAGPDRSQGGAVMASARPDERDVARPELEKVKIPSNHVRGEGYA